MQLSTLVLKEDNSLLYYYAISLLITRAVRVCAGHKFLPLKTQGGISALCLIFSSLRIIAACERVKGVKSGLYSLQEKLFRDTTIHNLLYPNFLSVHRKCNHFFYKKGLLMNNAVLWDSQTHSVNNRIHVFDFNWVFLEIPMKHCIGGMLLTCAITISFSHTLSLWG